MFASSKPRDHPLDRRRLELQSGGADAGEVVAELGAGQHVDDEVDGRVEDGHHVADRRVVVVPLAARGAQRLVEHRPEDVIDERRSLADNEREHDDDKDQRHVGLVPLEVPAHGGYQSAIFWLLRWHWTY